METLLSGDKTSPSIEKANNLFYSHHKMFKVEFIFVVVFVVVF
jgi:hypothetical protein